ncbi:MAG: PEP-CTERM sorting domain-containing protein [Leptolyngbyaceae cyanobacterium SM1_1_3]|nr:PEP-CTERM sorting domain-containing protein [Leptolyngbyaceae cyanobacterium SM1_1_3]NJN01374.1 PEP-CTERM sorting domain-containing protein [Leptolyngbyaceae cyanobacterium RM1_1_2]NJO10859.1 PEP-CTERM sorting domain-containing protein [Leptolyngbyaceae cyanobacterium SL_1_1]
MRNYRAGLRSLAVLGALVGLGVAAEAEAALLVGNTALTTDGRGYNVLRFDERSGRFLGEFISTGSGGLVSPDDLTFGPDGNLYVSSGNDGATPETEPSAILRFDGLTGEFIDVFATSPTLNRPYGNAFGPDGKLYVSSFLSDQILRFDGVTGEFIDVFASGSGLPGGLNGPNDLLFLADGSLLVTTQGSVAVSGEADFSAGLPSQTLKFDIATGESTVFADQPMPTPESFGFVSFLGLALGPDGNLFTSDFANGIRVYDLNTGGLLSTFSTNYTGTLPSNNFIGSLAFTPDNTLFSVGFDFTQGNLGAILRYDGLTGEPLPSAGNFGPIFVPTNSNLIRPIGIAYADLPSVPEPALVLGLLSLAALGFGPRRTAPTKN